MAFNIATFKTRAITAVLFVIIMLWGLLWNQWSFLVLFCLIHFGCWYEFVKLLKKIHPQNYGFYSLTGLIYITFPIAIMLSLAFPGSNYHRGFFLPAIPCIIIFSIWINDTMAYLVGSLIGKTPFSKISPKKTWEGTVGGVLLCVLVMGFFVAPQVYKILAPGHRNVEYHGNWFVIAGVCAIFGTAGDLLESKLKRLAGVKDSGNFMPGHGGFMDRFDSILLATPFAWTYVYFFMR